MTATLTVRSAAGTDRGLVRAHNLDAAWVGEGLVAVADGFGPDGFGLDGFGLEGFGPGGEGATVSVCALEALASQPVTPGELVDGMRMAVRRAAGVVGELTAPGGAYAGGGTTLTALAWLDSEIALAHIGDSRAYLLHDGRLLQLTQDDTEVQHLIDIGQLTEEQARMHPRRGVLTKALHAQPESPSVVAQYPEPGDRYLLCSDGLHNVLPPPLLGQLLGWDAEPIDVVRELISQVHAAGAPDNVACAVADVLAT